MHRLRYVAHMYRMLILGITYSRLRPRTKIRYERCLWCTFYFRWNVDRNNRCIWRIRNYTNDCWNPISLWPTCPNHHFRIRSRIWIDLYRRIWDRNNCIRPNSTSAIIGLWKWHYWRLWIWDNCLRIHSNHWFWIDYERVWV